MKKFILLVVILLTLTGCGEEIPDLPELPAEYNQRQAIDDGYYVVILGTDYNAEVMDKFIADVDSGKESKVRSVQTTTEGDPIIYDIHYKDGIFYVRADISRDKFGDPNNDFYYFEFTGYTIEDHGYWLSNDEADVLLKYN